MKAEVLLHCVGPWTSELLFQQAGKLYAYGSFPYRLSCRGNRNEILQLMYFADFWVWLITATRKHTLCLSAVLVLHLQQSFLWTEGSNLSWPWKGFSSLYFISYHHVHQIDVVVTVLCHKMAGGSTLKSWRRQGCFLSSDILLWRWCVSPGRKQNTLLFNYWNIKKKNSSLILHSPNYCW